MSPGLDLSVVAAARDEVDNVQPLVEQIRAALLGSGLAFEILVVDDGSSDGTDAALAALAAGHPGLRALRLEDGGGHGQGVAWRLGIVESRGRLIATIDADLQNDPADLPGLVAAQRETGADVVQGRRTSRVCDGWRKRASSAVGRAVRRLILGDRVPDTGCSLRVMRRAAAEALPLDFRGMHRFVPELARQLGFTVIERPVAHRPRGAGRTKYGVRNRALSGLADALAVRWMQKRRTADPAFVELGPGRPEPPVVTVTARSRELGAASRP